MKKTIIAAIEKELDERLNIVTQAYNDALASRNNDTKSSAGDKYETSRAMMQQEMDNAEKRIHQVKFLKNELNRLPTFEGNSDVVISGSLVKTNKAIYFLGLGLGKIIVDDQVVYAISTASPLGKLLLNSKIGDKISLNAIQQEIISIT